MSSSRCQTLLGSSRGNDDDDDDVVVDVVDGEEERRHRRHHRRRRHRATRATNNDDDKNEKDRRSFLEERCRRLALSAMALSVPSSWGAGPGGGGSVAVARGLVRFPCRVPPLSNVYHFLRSGSSLLEVENVWSTNPLFL